MVLFFPARTQRGEVEAVGEEPSGTSPLPLNSALRRTPAWEGVFEKQTPFNHPDSTPLLLLLLLLLLRCCD